MVKKIVLAVVCGSIALSASACNAVRGAANDVESVGDCVDGRPGNC